MVDIQQDLAQISIVDDIVVIVIAERKRNRKRSKSAEPTTIFA